MKTALLFIFLSAMVGELSAQQFQLEWNLTSYDGSYYYLGDIDNDNIGEFYCNGDYDIYSGIDGSLKYSFSELVNNYYFPDGNVIAGQIDFNNNGVNDVYTTTNNTTIKIVDPKTREIIFSYYSASAYNIRFQWIGDFDNDNIIEIAIIIQRVGTTYHSYNIRVYSTGIDITSLIDADKYRPKNFSLSQNFPNPFNPTTTIEYEVSEPGLIQLLIFDSLGSMVTQLVNREQAEGNYTSTWNGTDQFGNKVASGTYFYQVKSGNQVATKKMVLLK